MMNRLALAILSLSLAYPLGSGFMHLHGQAVFGRRDPRIVARGQVEQELSGGDLARMGGMQFRHGDRIFFVAYLPDGKELITGSEDGTLRLWNATTGREMRKFARDQRVRSYPIVGDRLQRRGERLFALSLAALSPDGRFLAASPQSPDIRVFDVLTGMEVGDLNGHEGGVVSLRFSPDGKRLFSGSLDGTALTWDMAVFARKERPQLVQIDADAGRRLWEDLASADAEAAFRSVRKLWASPTVAVSLLTGRLKPVPAVDAERIRKLLADLDAKSFSVRQKATADLEKVGDLAAPAMREALAKGVTVEARQRLEQLLRNLTLRSPEGELIRNLRAVEVLEHIGTPEARQVLQTLAGGSEGRG
jgi:hypothetical protein